MRFKKFKMIGMCLFNFRNSDFDSMMPCHFRFFEPRRFVSHEHLAMLDDALMDSQIPAPLQSDPGSIFSIIETGVQTLSWASSLWGMYSEMDRYFNRSRDRFRFDDGVINHIPEPLIRRLLSSDVMFPFKRIQSEFWRFFKLLFNILIFI